MGSSLIMKVLWRSEDYLSNNKNYTKDLIMGGVLDVECMEYLQPKKQGTTWVLKQEFDVNEINGKKIPYPAD